MNSENHSARRNFLLSSLTTTLAAAALSERALSDSSITQQVSHGRQRDRYWGLDKRIADTWNHLPGTKALLIEAPKVGAYPAFRAQVNPETPLFCASSFKGYVLAEYLRQTEQKLMPGSHVSLADQWKTWLAQPWELNEEVFSPGAPVLNPPHLSEQVNILTALEAMISRSDNTATDMTLHHTGADNVQRFLKENGLNHTRFPTTTRQFFGYIAGYPDWPHITWAKLVELMAKNPYTPHPMVNDTITMVSSPSDFVSFYSRALQGKFFQHAATLDVFRSILMLADAIPLTMPLGVNIFMKGGSIDFAPDFALSLAGGMWIPNRWVYFSMMINWKDTRPGAFEATLPSFLAASKQVFTWLRDELSSSAV